VSTPRPLSLRKIPSRRSVTAGGFVAIVIMSIWTIVLIGLLARTEHNADGIRHKAADIARSGRGINDYTDSIMQLSRTNQLAASILKLVSPLGGDLSKIDALAADIDGSVGGIQKNASAINASASAIGGSAETILGDVTNINRQAGSINDSLTGVNTNASAILTAAGSIERGIALINTNASQTAAIVRAILSDAGGIDSGAVRTDHLAHCIDNGLNGGPKC
jgi:methyl-accepting chemotaxis protein